MAKHYPKSEFAGFDYHDKSIDTAKRAPRTPASPPASSLKWPWPKPIPAATTISSPTLIVCTTWAILGALRSTCTAV